MDPLYSEIDKIIDQLSLDAEIDEMSRKKERKRTKMRGVQIEKKQAWISNDTDSEEEEDVAVHPLRN